MNTLYTLMSGMWGAVAIAALVAVAGGLVAWTGCRHAITRFGGYMILGVAVILVTGSILGLRQIAEVRQHFPPPGRLIDVGGYRMHIIAEGDAGAGATVIWIPGSHAPGIDLYHLHKALRGETRSILFDRPGSGWSEPGPYPRSTAREAQELHTLLANAHERGPFILIGHSYGGLLAANFARRFPQQTAAVVLLDATPADTFSYMPGGTGPAIPAGIVHEGERSGWKLSFGLQADEDLARGDPQVAQLLKTIDTELADVREARNALASMPANAWATASIFREWRDPALVADLVVYDGELAAMPVWMVIPADDIPSAVEQFHMGGASPQRMINFLERSRLRYMNVSSRMTLVHPPSGTSHNFPYQAPQTVVEVVRQALAQTRPSGS